MDTEVLVNNYYNTNGIEHVFDKYLFPLSSLENNPNANKYSARAIFTPPDFANFLQCEVSFLFMSIFSPFLSFPRP